MPGFVAGRHERLDEARLQVTGGDAGVVRHPAAERVVADVEPAPLEVEAEQAHDLDRQLTLLLHRERPLEGRHLALAIQGRLQRPGKKRFQILEDRLDVGHAQLRLVDL